MVKKFMISCTIAFCILLTGCQTTSPDSNSENIANLEDNKQNSSQENLNNQNNQNDFVTDDSDIKDGSQINVNSSLRELTDRKVKISVDGRTFTLTLYDSKTADDLWHQLPLSITANNYSGWEEKICPLGDKDLSMENAPQGDCPLIPEVGYYKPGNWIALYYGEIGYWSGKVPLGTIDASSDELKSITGGSSIIFEKMSE